MMGLGMLFMVLFWGGLILLAVLLVRAIFSGNSTAQSSTIQEKSSTALEILAQRYARGEITREQYEIMKKDLS